MERGTAAEIQIQKQSKYSCTDSNPLYYLIVGSLERWHLAMLVAPGILSEHRNEEYGQKQIQICPQLYVGTPFNRPIFKQTFCQGLRFSDHRKCSQGTGFYLTYKTLILYFNLAMTISNIIYCQRWTGFIISIRPTLSVNCQIVICSDIPCPARPIIINWARFEENIAVCNFND